MSPTPWQFDRHLRYSELVAWLEEQAQAHPDLVSLEVYGTSAEGRDLLLVTLTEHAADAHDTKPAHWVDANIHATELTACIAACRLIIRLVTGFESGDPVILEALATRTFYVVPRVNPDGAELALADVPRYVRSSTRPWPHTSGDPLPGLFASDVDGDGRVLQMRIEDPAGGWMPHPDDQRLLIPVPINGAATGVVTYRLLTEGTVVDFDGFTVPTPKPPEGLDLNRNFPRAKEPDTIRGEPAGTVWSFVRTRKPDWVIDLHEGYHFHRIESKSVGSSIIDTKSKATNKIVPAMLKAVDAPIEDPKKKFSRLSPPANGSLTRAAAEHLGAEVMILETTRREQAPSHRARQHRIMVHTLLAHLGMVAPDAPNLVTPPKDPATVRVALFDGAGTNRNGWGNVRKVASEIPGSLLWHVGPEDIREGALGQFDLVVFPGGSGSKQAAAIGDAGREQVREFVNDGGGYLGICAGAYLAASNYKWSLAISNHRTFCEARDIPDVGRKSMWFRGPAAQVTMELTADGDKILGDRNGVIDVRYQNGPIMSPAENMDLPDYRVLAWFRSENALYDTQKGTMTNTPAIIASDFGKGHVLCISPHPESSPTLRPMVLQGLRWAAGDH